MLSEGLEPSEADETADRIANAALHRLVLIVPHGGASVELESLRLSDYLCSLLNEQTEAARPFIQLLTSIRVRRVPLDPQDVEDPDSVDPDHEIPCAWVVSKTAATDVLLIERTLCGE